MSCSSAIYTVNNTPQDLLGNAQIPFGSIVRRYGCNLDLNGFGIVVQGEGYYKCDCSVTLEPTAIGEVSAQLYVNGMPYQGAIQTGYSAAAGNPVPLSFPAIIRIPRYCCDTPMVLEIRLGEEGATATNMAFSIVKI